MNTVDDRIAAALRARTDSVTEADLAPAVPPSGRVIPLARGRWTMPLLAAAVAGILAFATVTVVQLNRPTGHPAGPVPQPSVSLRQVPPSTVAPSPTDTSAQVSATPSPPPSSAPPSSAAPTPTSSQPVSQPFALGYEPLWPFRSYAEAEQWRINISSPLFRWRLDAGQVALAFTHNLPIDYVDVLTGTRMDSQGAHVGVGWRDPNGQLHTAATLHLVRYGTAPDSPWEVVGSDDTTFSLEQPAYGSKVTSPMTIGGHITGVDENIVVSLVRRVGSNAADIESKILAQVPAGGDHAAWTTGPVPFTDRGVLIVLATTGGHLQQVERFAIQGVHT